jgi:aspartate/methionine/tyrosine aminotransferase
LPGIAARGKHLLDTNRALFETILDSVNYFLDIVYPPYGTIVFPRLKSGDMDRLNEILRTEYDTSVVPGSFFDLRDHFRIGLGGAAENVQQGLTNLKMALERL